MTKFCSVYATFASQDEAEKIALLLVEEGLAACVNILPALHSIYRWQGKVQQDTEYAFFAKTQMHLSSQLTARIVQLHSYDVPCVVVLPIVDGNPAYLEWIAGAS